MSDVAIAVVDEGTGAPIAAVPVSPDPEPPPAPTSGRADYDAFISLKNLTPGEPYFILRGRDQVAAEIVRTYAAAIRREGADDAMVESALQLADRIEAHPEKRLVDADHLTDGEARHLRHQLTRRAHRAAAAADIALTLTEVRAQATAYSRLRYTLRDLFVCLEPTGDGGWRYNPAMLARGGPKDGLAPAPCPIEALKRFAASLGRELPPETMESQLVRARGILRELLELKRLKAREGATLRYRMRREQAWAEAQRLINGIGGGLG